METKVVTLKLNDEQLMITVCGDKKLLDQISLKPKKIRLFCENSELKVMTSYLFEHLQSVFKNNEFLIENTIFVKDRTQKNFLFLTNNKYYFILNNKELRIPLKIQGYESQSYDNLLESCNAFSFSPKYNFILE